MSHHHIEKNEDVYYVAYNNAGIVHYGYSGLDHSFITGQPNLETFTTPEELKNRVEELGKEWKDPRVLPPVIDMFMEDETAEWVDSNGVTWTINDILI